MMNPAIAIPMMEARGMPQNVASMLSAVWFHQQCYLQVACCASPEPELVKSSLPQGGAWSMIALCAVMSCPAEAIKALHGGVHVAYFDDRTWAAKSAAECWAIGGAWKHWSS